MSRVHKPPRSASQKAHDQREIARLYLKEGKTQLEIAVFLNIDQATVSRDLRDLRKEWAKDAQRELVQWQGEMLQEIRLLKAEAWQQWTLGKLPGGEDEPDTKPDPRYLAEIRQAIATQYKVLGLDKLAQFMDDLTELSDEVLQRIAAGKS